MKRAFADHLINTGRADQAAIDAAVCNEWASREPIGRLALLHGLLSGSDIDRILLEQSSRQGFFGEIALRLKLLTPEQLRVLLLGQGVRACVELVEDLVLAGVLDIEAGLAGMLEFTQGDQFVELCCGDLTHAG